MQQVSAPHPKMIRILNPNSSLNQPKIFQSSDNNFGLLVSKTPMPHNETNEMQHTVFSNYQYTNQASNLNIHPPKQSMPMTFQRQQSHPGQSSSNSSVSIYMFHHHILNP